jgi:hypothetical protein
MSSPRRYVLVDEVPDRRERLLWVTLQGLVNREAPGLYLLADPQTDGHWVEWYAAYGLEPERLAPDAALERLLPRTNGAYVLGAQDADWEIPLAVTLAGLEDRVLVTPEQAEALRGRGLALDPLPVPVFRRRLEAMAWAAEELRPRTAPALLHANYWPRETDNIDIVDWVVAGRGFSYRLTTNPHSRPGERALLGEIFRASPLYAHVLGWHQRDDGECSHVDFASRHGLVPFCMTRNLNFSFHRHVPAREPFAQALPAEVPPLEPAKAYLTFVFSDGDAPHSMADLQKRQWLAPERGQVPFGWALPPQQTLFGPAMLEYYYATRSEEDELLCGPSGLGYNYLSAWATARPDVDDPQAARQAYLARSNEQMEALQLACAWPINRLLEWLPDGRLARRLAGPEVWGINPDAAPHTYGVDFMDDEVIRDYCTHLPTSVGFFQGWHPVPHETVRCYHGRPYFPGKILAANPDQTLEEIRRLVAVERTPCFIPVHVNCYAMGMAGVVETIQRLDPQRHRTLLPSTFLRLAAGHLGG